MNVFQFLSSLGSIQPKVKLGNGEIVQVKGKQVIFISTKKGKIIVKDVIYVSKLNQNFLSVEKYKCSLFQKNVLSFDEHETKMNKVEMIGYNFHLKLDLVKCHDFIVKIDESCLAWNIWSHKLDVVKVQALMNLRWQIFTFGV